MKKWGVVLSTILVMGMIMGCGGPSLPEKLEVALTPAKGYEGGATGTVVIDTKTGTDVTIAITGLKPDGLYTAFFVNVKSKMFQGVGQEPYVIPVDANGVVSFNGKIDKNSFLRFRKVAIYLNPGGEPVKNPLGVKAKLGALMKKKKAKMVLEGKLR
jgi:uncharacterized alpha/beta hydrolase family protein